MGEGGTAVVFQGTEDWIYTGKVSRGCQGAGVVAVKVVPKRSDVPRTIATREALGNDGIRDIRRATVPDAAAVVRSRVAADSAISPGSACRCSR